MQKYTLNVNRKHIYQKSIKAIEEILVWTLPCFFPEQDTSDEWLNNQEVSKQVAFTWASLYDKGITKQGNKETINRVTRKWVMTLYSFNPWTPKSD